MMPTLVLASASPRRKQLLEMLGLSFLVQPSQVQEIALPGEAPTAYSRRLARDKARAVPGHLVLGADTIVVRDDAILEKPKDDDDALRMLLSLQGRSHVVVTAICLVADGVEHHALDQTRVTFRPCTAEFLRDYIATGEPRDKAGAYGIQGWGAALVERIDGDFFSVMGLPVRLVLELLERAGHPYRFARSSGE
ncbi:MAG TPA: Maf family protein [Gemmatimonadales bacterium]|jgi:septum formation protein|nr:Maf family protein [Gemmatimonadales bacterium]